MGKARIGLKARRAAESLVRWWEDPRVFVREQFGVEPDAWQDEVLGAFPETPRIALQACKGNGKTALVAWLVWNFLATRPHPKVAATSVTGDNLRDCLWAELAKWHQRSPMLRGAFTCQAKRIFANDHPETWWCSARTWSRDADPEQQADTLAGLHSDYMLFVIDESGAVPRSVMAAAQAAMSSGIECHIVQAGNPLRLSGALHDAVTVERGLWRTWKVTADPDDPLRTPRVSIEYAREMIATYGRDHPWVIVNILGEFPPYSWDALIGPDEIAAAERRSYREHDIEVSARILGVDVARYGDDASVVFPRQGLVAFTPKVYRNLDGPTGAAVVSRQWEEWKADACFVDDTGGFGAAWLDQLRVLGRTPVGIHFSAAPHDRKYANKRAEMYFEAVQWIKAGGQLPPNVPELGQALTQMVYTFARNSDRLIIEDKSQLKARLGFSPDHADAFALTFAEPVASPRQRGAGRRTGRFRSDYNPYAVRDDERIRGVW